MLPPPVETQPPAHTASRAAPSPAPPPPPKPPGAGSRASSAAPRAPPPPPPPPRPPTSPAKPSLPVLAARPPPPPPPPPRLPGPQGLPRPAAPRLAIPAPPPLPPDGAAPRQSPSLPGLAAQPSLSAWSAGPHGQKPSMPLAQLQRTQLSSSGAHAEASQALGSIGGQNAKAVPEQQQAGGPEYCTAILTLLKVSN